MIKFINRWSCHLWFPILSLSRLFVWCLFLCLLACFLYSFFSFHSWIFCNWYFPRCRNRIIISSFVWWSLAMQSWGRLLTLVMCMLAKKSSEGPRTHKNEQVSCLIPWGQDRSACWELLFMNTWGHSKKIGKKWLSELSVWLLFALVSSQFYSFPS